MNIRVLKNARVLGEDFKFLLTDLVLQDGNILSVGKGLQPVIRIGAGGLGFALEGVEIVQHLVQIQPDIVHKLPLRSPDLQRRGRKGDMVQRHQIRGGIRNDSHLSLLIILNLSRFSIFLNLFIGF